MSLSLPVPVSQVSQHVPHRAPMIWIDEVNSYSATSGVCSVTIQPDSYFLSEGVLRASSCVELIGQAYGFANACYLLDTGDKSFANLKRALLVSIVEAQLPSLELRKRLKIGDRLRIEVSNKKKVGPFVPVSGHVALGTEILASASLRIYIEG